MKMRKRASTIAGKNESQEEALERLMHEYGEKMRGNAYLQEDVWVIAVRPVISDGITILGFDPEGEDYTLLLAYTSRPKAEAYLNSEAMKGEKAAMTVENMPLGILAILAMIGTVRNIGIDKRGDGSDYEMLDVIKMKSMFDDGLTLDE